VFEGRVFHKGVRPSTFAEGSPVGNDRLSSGTGGRSMWIQGGSVEPDYP